MAEFISPIVGDSPSWAISVDISYDPVIGDYILTMDDFFRGTRQQTGMGISGRMQNAGPKVTSYRKTYCMHTNIYFSVVKHAGLNTTNEFLIHYLFIPFTLFSSHFLSFQRREREILT